MGPDASSITSHGSRYQLKKKASWKLAGEVASLAPVLDASGKRVLLVGQQAGRYSGHDSEHNAPVDRVLVSLLFIDSRSRL